MTKRKSTSPQKGAVPPAKAARPASTKAASADHATVSTAKKSAAGFERVFEQIYRLVLRIPAGRVMTYGQIARLLDERYSPRLVGWAMHATPKDARNIPWHRVINARGSTSTGRLILHEPDLQRLLLEHEGVIFNDKAQCDLSVYQWSPVERKPKVSAPTKTRQQIKASSTSKTKSPTTGKKN
ncbi:MAG: MGMT family protein [Acidobacteria bacterium]|nr:MGMT family protein [Acidobacteriota bacterium]